MVLSKMRCTAKEVPEVGVKRQTNHLKIINNPGEMERKIFKVLKIMFFFSVLINKTINKRALGSKSP